MTKANLQLQLHGSAGGKMPVDGRDAARFQEQIRPYTSTLKAASAAPFGSMNNSLSRVYTSVTIVPGGETNGRLTLNRHGEEHGVEDKELF
jgi:hypothetical protein